MANRQRVDRCCYRFPASTRECLCTDKKEISRQSFGLKWYILTLTSRDQLLTLLFVHVAIDSTNAILDNLRHLKSSIEGTSFTFRPITINHDHLAILRHLVVAHVPNTLHDDTKKKIEHKVTDLLKGQVKRVIYSCIITCPWFAAAQTEISTGAKNNILFVVYVANDEHFFSLATPHEKELCETIDSVSHYNY